MSALSVLFRRQFLLNWPSIIFYFLFGLFMRFFTSRLFLISGVNLGMFISYMQFVIFNVPYLATDLKNKGNRLLNITATSPYLIDLSYLLFSFLVFTTAEFMFSFLDYILVFIYSGVFYYQSLGYFVLNILTTSILYTVYTHFLCYFAARAIKYIHYFIAVAGFIVRILSGYWAQLDFIAGSIDPFYIPTQILKLFVTKIVKMEQLGLDVSYDNDLVKLYQGNFIQNYQLIAFIGMILIFFWLPIISRFLSNQFKKKSNEKK